jgi:D-3-phosphoglycerate dehydrogenase
MDAEFAPHMLYVTNEDKPGFIGKLGTAARRGTVPETVLAELRKLPVVKQAKALVF